MTEETIFEFDPDFQEKIVALQLRDPKFCLQTEGLVEPHYFTTQDDAAVFMLAQEYWVKYREAPSPAIWGQILKDALAGKLIKKDDAAAVVAKMKVVGKLDISDRKYVVDKLDEFAKNQAHELAIMQCVDLVEKRDFEGVRKVIETAQQVGATLEDFDYDYFEGNDQRRDRRHAIVSGTIVPQGIPSGIRQLDEQLYHRGWGRTELTAIAGAAKAGKSMTCVTFAANAVRLGYNVLFVSLEVSKDIVSDRFDANFSRVPMNQLNDRMAVAHGKIEALRSKNAGKLHIVDYPSGQFKPSDLNRLMHKQASRGHEYDMVVVDYADIMKPNVWTQNPIENSKAIFIDLRAIAQEFDVAMLTPTQLNREGFKAVTGKMEHVADDINKVRTVDLMISINATQDEKERGEARLYFAASRNQEDGFTARMKVAKEMSNMAVAYMGNE